MFPMAAPIRRNVALFFPRHCSRSFSSRKDLGSSMAAETPSEANFLTGRNKEAGLYGYEILKSPKGFQRFVREAIERSGELISYVSQLPPSVEIIRAMDEISDTVCSVVDSAELCRNTHPDREFVEEANKASIKIYEYLHFLNTNHDLYNAVVKAEQEGFLPTKEAQRAAHTLRIDFEKGGIHLGAGKLDRVNKLNIEIAQLGREFSENIVTDPGHVDIFPSTRIPKHIQHVLQPIYRTKSGKLGHSKESRDKIEQMGFRIATDPGTLSSILKWVPDAEVRKQAYISGNSVPKSNLDVLDKLIAARHELAQVVASYFPLSQCLEGLKVLVESLFGATFHSIPLGPGESWHPDVLKMSLHHSKEGDLGYLYLDLYSRKGKYPGCAHFAIKGGRRISETEYQLPVVALVCNFSAAPGSSTARLNHWEVETLFHEFGHALHSLLSRTDYQHFSGTRMVLDLAETPSNLFEYYAWDYRVLRTFARHYSSGDIIPEKLVNSMNDAKSMFAATELQRQIFFSLLDQTLFGEQLSTPRDTISIVANLKTQHTSWKHVEGTHWHTRFNHLINYGAGYYSYLYARCFAGTIWQEMCLQDPLSLSTGSALRTKFLQHGGAKDPAHLLKDFVGDGVLKYCNGGIVPNISSLCKELNL